MIDKVSGNAATSYTREAQVTRETTEVNQNKLRASTPSAEVELSTEAQLLQKTMKSVQNAPEVRDDVVHGIQNQLKAGTYQVDHQKLAEKIISLLA